MGAIAKANGEKNIAVLTCGPKALVSDARKLAFKSSLCGDVKFDFHTETFDF